MPRVTTVHAFTELFTPDPRSGCWLWRKAPTKAGYGLHHNEYAHRLAWRLHRGPIPSGLEIDHKCRNKICVNPDHLEPVSHRENMLRAPAATKTHCEQGHSLHDAYVQRNKGRAPSRRCRVCAKANAARQNKKRVR